MWKFATSRGPADPARSGAPAAGVAAPTRLNASVRRQFSYFWGYVAILGFLTMVAGAALGMALWRLLHLQN